MFYLLGQTAFEVDSTSSQTPMDVANLFLIGHKEQDFTFTVEKKGQKHSYIQVHLTDAKKMLRISVCSFYF